MLKFILWPVLVPSFLFGVGTGAIMPIMVLAALQLGASAPFASAIVAIMGAVALAVTVPVGMLIDRIGDKRAMALATGCAAAMTSLIIVALAFPSRWSLALFVASIILRTPASVGWNLARQAVVAETVPTQYRGQAMTALGGTMRAGNLVGPLCGALLLWKLPMWSVFAFGVATAVVATILLFIPALNSTFDAQTRQNRESRTEEELAVGVRWRAVGLAGVAMSTLAIARVGQPILMALWGVHLGWTESQISLMVAVGAAVELLLMVPGGYFKDVIGRAPILIVCLLVYGAGFALAPLWPTSPGFIVAVLVMSVGNGLGAGINMTIGADLSPARGRAKFLSIWAMFSQGGALGGPLMISGLLLVASLPVAMTAVGVFAVAGAAWMGAWARVVDLPRGVQAGRSPEPPPA